MDGYGSQAVGGESVFRGAGKDQSPRDIHVRAALAERRYRAVAVERLEIVEAATIEAANGDYDAALRLLAPFEDTQALPASLQQRARALREVYTYDGQQQPVSDPE